MNLTRKMQSAIGGAIVKAATTYNLDTLWKSGKVSVGDFSESGLDLDGMVANAYANSAVAFACIRRIYMDASGVPLVFLSDPEDFESAVGPDDPLRRLFSRPNSAMTMRRLIAWTTLMRALRGECFWAFNDTMTEVYPWHDPKGWKEKTSGEAGLYGWEFRQGNTAFQRAARDVLWTGEENPANPYRGVSPLQAAATSLAIDRYGDRVHATTLERGGERGLVLSSDLHLNQQQQEQLRVELARRRSGDGKVSRDVILPANLSLENPDFTKEDLDILAMQNASKDKICHVYGMAPVLIGDDDAAQFKSAPEAIKLYWQQTLVPLLRSLEDAWDKFFVYDRGLGTYVRFDLSQTPAMQEDQQEVAQTFAVYVQAGVPMAAVNSKLGTGFADEDMIIGEALDDDPEPAPEPEQRSMTKGLTNEVIRKRALDPRFKVQRERRLSRIERSTWNRIKDAASDHQAVGLEAVRDAVQAWGMTPKAAQAAIAAIAETQADVGGKLQAAVEPGHREAAQVGIASIQEITDGKMLAWHDRVKAISFTPEVEDIMRQRGRYIRANIARDLVGAINEAVMGIVELAAEENETIGWVVGRLRETWSGWTSKHATTIARTEVGTMYNTARFDEMGQQGYRKHEWLTSLDEMTRDGTDSRFDHASADGEVRRVGEPFSTGLAYPQENGGAAGNVINCRCETIPAVED